VKAPAPDARPYAWAIEYPAPGVKAPLVTFIANDGDHDRAYVERRAAELHGVIVVLPRDRRADP
jgi:hypothetical protein